MNVRVLGSSSSGNGYIIGDDTQQLVIEAGLQFKEVMRALDYNISNIQGVIVSHEHG